MNERLKKQFDFILEADKEKKIESFANLEGKIKISQKSLGGYGFLPTILPIFTGKR